MRSVAKALVVLLLYVSVFTGVSFAEGIYDKQAGEKAKNEKVLTVELPFISRGLDPQLCISTSEGTVINNLYEGLMREVKGKLEPAAAESYEVSKDGMRYTFKLRNTNWSDGKPVTAGDFEYAWKRLLDPQTTAEMAFMLYGVKGAEDYNQSLGTAEQVGIKAVDDRTLEVVLKEPMPQFLSILSLPMLMPVRKDGVEKSEEGWSIDPQKAVSNGPFVLEAYDSAGKALLKKNAEYWKAGDVKLDKIHVLFVPDEDAALTAYYSGEVDILNSIPVSEISRLQAEEPNFYNFPQVGTAYYVFNTSKAPLDNKLVRKALSLAVNRKVLIDQYIQGGQIPATGFTPPGLVDMEGREFHKTAGNYGIDPNDARIEEAKKLLAEAGYAEGKDFPEVELLYNTSEANKLIAETIQEMWQKNLGIKVKLISQEWVVFMDQRSQGNFHIARAGWMGDYADPVAMLELWTSSSALNDGKWKSPEFDKLIEDSKLAVGQKRFDLLYKAQDIMMEEMIVMPLYYYTDPMMVRDYVKGWERTSGGYLYFGDGADILK
ncbi:peptide ABC transporter substrate-binding protein [Geosporobacter ferrireducens]|uniref:Solute-binding protein family 5 domain-containing protein n=1 Tax=Geosporobacter ferrireducens TaxID=1424294 RepID=A0A1D8GJ38_9FIRM|nr:peptide ABC transporter substrate-binding protein [Geosporobacter ferrireducens]AOT70852.1 hypothetical protein Gferi_15590 [Geosporobacter ferrireducens]